MATFVRRDLDILSTRFRMVAHFYSGRGRGLPDILRILWGVLTSDFSFSWFGYHQAYWAVRFSQLLGRRSIVVLGGFDVCEEEDPHFHRRIAELQYILRNASCLLAVSRRVQAKAEALIEGRGKIPVVYHGFDSVRFRPTTPKLAMAVTVAYLDENSVRRKGIETFVRAARFLPDVEFVVVGESLDGSGERLKAIATPNVRFTGKLPEADLIRVLQQTAVYVQASLHEAFGCSLAEAMLCGCVPVASGYGAIPEVVGDTGISVRPEDPKDVARGIREGMTTPGLGLAARERIVRLFPAENRQRALLASVERLFK